MSSSGSTDRPAGRDLHPPNMPEQAQRRAPVGQPQPQENPPDDKHALEELRHLIIAPEQKEIAEIQERLDDRKQRAEDVSSIVAEAIQIRRERGGDRALSEALAPTIQDTLRESVRKNPHVLADALFPVMGPAIRKSITEALRGMLESFNQALEYSLSVRGLQWRIEALRTGKSFGEIVLMHSLLYRVEQVFLIHRKTGLVLGHVVAQSVATQDPSMVAGMLSAIQQFVADSFDARSDETLDSLNVGGLEVFVEQSPDAVIAAVIRGHAPADYRLAMKEALEEIQQQYSAALEDFEGDAGPFLAVDDRLGHLLTAQLKEKQGPQKKPVAAIVAVSVIALVAIGWLGYSSYLLFEWSRFLHAVRGQPGIVVLSYAKQNGRYHIQGFKDPLAEDPAKLLAKQGIDPQNAEFDLAPFYSLDDAIVLKRAQVMLHPPASVKLTEKDGQLIAEGVAEPKWIARIEERGPWIAGVHGVDISHLQNSDWVQMEPLKRAIESEVLLFPLGRAELESGQETKFAESTKNIRALLAQAGTLNEQVSIELIGHTDSTGIEATNLTLSAERAAKIRAALLRSGVPPAILRPRGVGTLEPLRPEDSEEGRRLNRSVNLKVVFSPTTPYN